MKTLLLRLTGPMQSWGTQSRFSYRDTEMEPSKSGVIGLLCAALGRPRSHPVDDLARLRMGVRVDREGIMQVDFHTAGGTHRKGDSYGVAKADGSKPQPVTSQRYYLADADFLVGLESHDEALLRQLDQALAHPKWPLYLGRKSFVPAGPVPIGYRPPDFPGPPEFAGIIYLPLEEVLHNYPWIPRTLREKEKKLAEIESEHQAGRALRLRMVLDAPFGSTAEVRHDVPLSFADRSFTIRYVETRLLPGNASHHHVCLSFPANPCG
ncbi:MAG: type I-E CRISPR-associated protein Cas5/CasD [Deltaproteobacteria bacterium]|nr:type I-E CRISPR-associated protein Cas5/CasD [Deltaproteobacteria bacterium]